MRNDQATPKNSSALQRGPRGPEPGALFSVFGVSKPAVGRYQKRVSKTRPAVFLDRDGTLIEEKEYLSDPRGVELVPGVGPALRKLMDAGYCLVVVTNQAGIGRGYYVEADMHAVNERLIHLLKGDGVRFDGIYFAPEAPGQPSRGRKPKPQFLLDARDALGIRLEDSFMVGDKRSDLECGWNAGIRQSILVRTGYGSEVEAQLGIDAARTVVLDDITAAAEWILRSRQPEL